MQNKTFRLFISSPFSDFTKEREVLHKRVFPKIEKYCSKHHLSFQPVDLRWGVNDEAQYDQKTLEVCLEEVRACKHFPHPNFLIMAGDRYGYVPLPYMIEKEEFEKIEAHLNKVDKYNYLKIFHPKVNLKLLKRWYKLDTNQIPSSYILQPRMEQYKEYSTWEKQEIQLRKILQDTADHIFKSEKDRESKEYKKYFTSATEAEVEEGIISYIKPTPYQEKILLKNNESLLDVDPEHIFGFFRDIDRSTQIKNKFIQHDYDEAQSFKKRVSRKLLDKNILHIQTIQKDEKSLEESYLKDFEKRITTFLEDQIDEARKAEEISELEQEISEQTKFLQDKVKGFQGRETILDDIENYLAADTTTEPLIIHGPSGMGKSSLMAEAVFRTDKNRDKENKKIQTDTIFRFVGATANSITIRNLLISIVDELQEKKIINPIDEYEVDDAEFETQIKDVLLSIEDKTKTTVTIFIDALDQLQHINYLNWLPGKLPSNLKIILTVLNDAEYKKDTYYYKVLSSRYNNKKHFIDITEDSLVRSKDALIKDLLTVEHRKLNKAQIDYLLKKWAKAEYSPLYLKIAIEEVKHWKNTDWTEDDEPTEEQIEFGKKQTLQNGVEGIIAEYLNNLDELYHHEVLLIKKVFGYIYAAKDGLSEQELLEILSEDLEDDEAFRDDIINEHHEAIKVPNPRRDGKEEHILPISIWSRLHTQIKPFIIERNIDGQPLMKFFHRQFTSVVEQYIKNEKTQLHIKLADYFFTLQDTSKTWDKRYNNLHMLDEYPYQLFQSNNSTQLKDILFDLEFTGSVYDHHKQDTFLEILGKASVLEGIKIEDIYPWKSFYLDNQYKIMMFDDKFWKPHQTLYQLAYEDGFNSPLTKKAYELYENDRIDFVWSRNSRVKPEYTRTNRVQSKELNITLDDDSRLYIDDEKIAIVKPSSHTFMMQTCFNNNLNEIKDFQALSLVNEDNNPIKEEKLNIESFFSGETFNVDGYKTLNLEKFIMQFTERYLDKINRGSFTQYSQFELDDIIEICEIHVLDHVEKLWDNSLLIQYDENYYDEKDRYYPDGYEDNYIVVVDIDQIHNITTLDEIEQYVSIDDKYSGKYKDNILCIYKDILFATPSENIISFDIDVHIREDSLLHWEADMSNRNIEDFISFLPQLPRASIFHKYGDIYLCSSDKQYIQLEDEEDLSNIVYIGHECFTVNKHIGGYKNADFIYIDFIPGNVYSLNGNIVYKSQDRILDVKTNKVGELIILFDNLIEIHQIKQINENIPNHFSKITNFADFPWDYDFDSPNIYLAGNEFITVCRSEGQHFSIKLRPEILDFNLTQTEYENTYFNSANIFYNHIYFNPTTYKLGFDTYTPQKEFRGEDLSFEPIGYTNLNDKYLDYTIEGATISTVQADSYDFFEKTLFYRAEHYILPNRAKKEYIVYNVPKRIKNTRSQDSLSRPIQLLNHYGVQMTVNIPREVSKFTDFITIPLLEGAFYILIDSNLNVDIYEIMNGTSMSSSMKPWLDPVKRGITEYSLIKMYADRLFNKKFLKDQHDLFRNGRMSDKEFVQTENFFAKSYHPSESLEDIYTLFQFWEKSKDILFPKDPLLTLEDFKNKPEEIILNPYGWLSNANNLLNRFSEIKEEFGIRELREISLFEIDAFIDYLSSQKYNEALEEFKDSSHEDEYEIIQMRAKKIHENFSETVEHNIEKRLAEEYSFKVDSDQDLIGVIDSSFDPETSLQELTFSDLLGFDFDVYLTTTTV